MLQPGNHQVARLDASKAQAHLAAFEDLADLTVQVHARQLKFHHRGGQRRAAAGPLKAMAKDLGLGLQFVEHHLADVAVGQSAGCREGRQQVCGLAPGQSVLDQLLKDQVFFKRVENERFALLGQLRVGVEENPQSALQQKACGGATRKRRDPLSPAGHHPIRRPAGRHSRRGPGGRPGPASAPLRNPPGNSWTDPNLA